MIVCFPELYDDELLYSVFARYYVKSGYMAYICVADDLYMRKSAVPDIEFINELTPEVVNILTQNKSMDNIVEKHTMFPYYGRFLPYDRRKEAFNAIVNMSGNYHNLLPIPNKNTGEERYLRYCPLCAETDRKIYGETYWHRQHQMIGIDICTVHYCRLLNSSVVIRRKTSPSLIAAEKIVPVEDNTVFSENQIEICVADYISELFKSKIDFESKTTIGQFLHSRMEYTPYRSTRGEQRNISHFYKDFSNYYQDLLSVERWKIEKILTDYRINTYEICLISMFLNMTVSDLIHMKLPQKSQQELFDEKIFQLHEQGLSYPQIAEKLNASVNVVKVIGEGGYKKKHKASKASGKSGAKQKDWSKIDSETLPLVKQAITELQGDGIIRPRKVTVSAIEKMLNLSSKQIYHMSVCKSEIQKHSMSQEEYWASEVVWAAKKLIHDHEPFNWKHIRNLTNMRKADLVECLPYISKFADKALCEKIMVVVS